MKYWILYNPRNVSDKIFYNLENCGCIPLYGISCSSIKHLQDICTTKDIIIFDNIIDYVVGLKVIEALKSLKLELNLSFVLFTFLKHLEYLDTIDLMDNVITKVESDKIPKIIKIIRPL